MDNFDHTDRIRKSKVGFPLVYDNETNPFAGDVLALAIDSKEGIEYISRVYTHDSTRGLEPNNRIEFQKIISIERLLKGNYNLVHSSKIKGWKI